MVGGDGGPGTSGNTETVALVPTDDQVGEGQTLTDDLVHHARKIIDGN